MKFTGQPSTLFGIKSSNVTMDGKTYDSCTFYLPVDFGQNANGKAAGVVTVPYRFGDSSEFDKWEHIAKNWPAAGVPVLCDFEVVQGRDASGRDTSKLVLQGIKPAPSAKAA